MNNASTDDIGTLASLARELGDPTRLAVLEHLANEGPSGVTELATRMDLAGPRLSNHLARLRGAGLVEVEREGRHVIYRLASPRLKELLASLRAAVDAPPLAERPTGVPSALSPLSTARSCYDHVAGRVGVGILDSLQRLEAVRPPTGVREDVELGPRARDVFAGLGIDVAGIGNKRRRFAFACQDWTERRPHLGGVLGAAVLRTLLDQEWVARETGTRALRITARGKRELSREFGLDL